LNTDELEQRARTDLETTMARSSSLRPDFDLNACRREHFTALDAFLVDRRAHHPDRYVAARLPDLPFADQSFDLVLCGHLLFTDASERDGELMREPGLDLSWHHPDAEALMSALPASWQCAPDPPPTTRAATA